MWLSLYLLLFFFLASCDYLRTLALNLRDLWRILICSLRTHYLLICPISLLGTFLGASLSSRFFISLFWSRWLYHLYLFLIFSVCSNRRGLALILGGSNGALLPLGVLWRCPLLSLVLNHPDICLVVNLDLLLPHTLLVELVLEDPLVDLGLLFHDTEVSAGVDVN